LDGLNVTFKTAKPAMPGLKHITTPPPVCNFRAKLLILVWLLLFSSTYVMGQDYTDRYRIVEWNNTNGLSLSFKNSMIQDAHGFLWITSPLGINKFDGGRFEVYHPEISGPAKPNSSYSFSLVEDSSHNIWIGTNKGLLFHDTRADTFGSIFPRISSYATITTIIPFAASSTQIFCIESANQIVAYNTSSFKRKLIAVISGDLTLKNSLMMQSSVFDPVENRIWIVKGDQFDQKDGLISIDVQTGKQSYYTWPCFHPGLKHQHSMRSICFDKGRRRIWINSVDGLLWYNLETGHVSHSAAWQKFSRSEKFLNALGINTDKQGNVWFPTNSDGMFIYHPEEDRIEPLFSDMSRQLKIAQGNMAIYFDKRDMAWLGYNIKKELIQLIRFNPAVTELSKEKINNMPVTNLVPGNNGLVVLGMPDGTRVWNTSTNTISDFKSSYGLTLAEGEKVIGMDTLNKKAWVLGFRNNGLREVDLITRRSLKINFPEEKDPVLNTLIENLARPYQHGIIVLSDNHGIYQVQPGKGMAEKIIDLPYHVTNIALANEEFIFIRLHFTARNLCFKRTADKWEQCPTPIDNINWSSVHFDKRTNSYWVGALQELYHFDGNFGLIKKYGKSEGLEALDLITLVSATDGTIWFNTSKGYIIHLDPATGIVAHLSGKDGFTGNQFGWQTPFLEDHTGAIIYAGNSGLVRVEPSKIRNMPSPVTYLKNILINGKPYSKNIYADNLTTLTLPHDHKNISFETGLIDFNDQQYSRIRYRMEGANDQWQIVNPGQNIQYNQLSPGQYKFILQASGSGNNFNGPKKVLAINIEPAFWQTTLFWLFSIALASLLIYLLARRRVRDKYKRKLEISLKELQLTEMKQKTFELEQKALALEMKTLRAQMNPHFIFNSLNSVNRFILQNNRNEASAYLTKFSKLIRMILQHSQEQLIPLENELDALKLYLELESIRFENRFEFKTSVQSSIETAEVKVPPLIIQPYAENAIWHGLMHKESKGRLDIEITAEGHYLFISITDDGVGREKAAGLESRPDNHKSIGMRLTQERIRNLGQGTEDAYVQVFDLTNPDGSPAGTEVTIKIPLIYD
jgi:ligand-binding sensor domain-containing protein/anti-sigma regulatory factor (Ser/Thr protein kinase)